jgi:glycosyltransferase involved in cell wall biosynthesis
MFSMHVDTARTWRGGQNQVLLTVLGLRAAGHRAMLVAHPDGELRRRASEGLDLVALAPRTEMDLSAGWRLSRVIRREAPAILHAHDPHAVAMASLAVSLDPRGPQPVLVASRRVDFRLKDHAFSRWKYRQVRMFICASEAIRQLLVAGGIEEERTVTVHEGIDIAHVDAAPRVDVHAELWLPHGAPVVGNIAALVPHKGQHDLVEAAALVVRELPDVRFLIVGEGELREALEHRVQELHLQKHVLLTGFRRDALGLLKAFDVFVMSSVNEGLGTSLLDAMACETPIVATTVGGIPEVVAHGETGLLVAPRAPREMAAAILRLLRNTRERQLFARAGRTRVLARFTVDRMVRETAAVYERLAGRGRATGSGRPARDGRTRSGPASPGDTGRSRTLWDPPDRDDPARR